MAAMLIGVVAFLVSSYLNLGYVDPLILALVFGIFFSSFVFKREYFSNGLDFTIKAFVPLGVFFYGLSDLNFAKILKVDYHFLFVILATVLAFCISIAITGRLLKQKKEITYLLSTGSAVCGASAIVITAPSIKARAEDVSISLLSITLAGIFGLFIMFPLAGALFGFNREVYALMVGALSHFTGFIKVAVEIMHPLFSAATKENSIELALSVKAVRYLGLFIFIPVFSSLLTKKFNIPRFLWAYLIAGIIGTFFYVNGFEFYKIGIAPIIKPIYKILWSVYLAAIGLNTNPKYLFSNYGAKAIIMSFAGFFTALVIFLLSIMLL